MNKFLRIFFWFLAVFVVVFPILYYMFKQDKIEVYTTEVGDYNKVKEYLENNLSIISPVKSFRGNFVITSLVLEHPNIVVVDYEDRLNAYSANFRYFIQEDIVLISQFKIIDSTEF